MLMLKGRNMNRLTILSIAAISAISAFLSCSPTVEFPSLEENDRTAEVYYLRECGGDIAIWRSAGDESADTGLIAEAGSEIAPLPDGALLYARGNALYRGVPGGSEETVAVFPGGICREIAEDRDTATEYVACWKVVNRFHDLTLSPDGGALAFVLEQVVRPLEDEKLEDFGDEDIELFVSRGEMTAECGVYVVPLTGGDPTYLGPGKQVFAFPETDMVIMEHQMVPVRVSVGDGDALPIITSDKYQYGWTPQVDYAGDKGVISTQKSDEKKNLVKNYVYELDGYAVKGKQRIKYVDGVNRITGLALAPGGDFVVLTIQTDRLGSNVLTAGSLRGGMLRDIVANARFLGFTPSGNGFFYYLEGEQTGRGDIYLAGLDGETVRITDCGDVMPPGFIR